MVVTELIFTKHTWPKIFCKGLQYRISWHLTNGLVIASRSLWDGCRWSPHKTFFISFIKNAWKVSFCLKEFTACPLHWQCGKCFIGKWSLLIVRITDNSNTVGGQIQVMNVPVGGTVVHGVFWIIVNIMARLLAGKPITCGWIHTRSKRFFFPKHQTQLLIQWALGAFVLRIKWLECETEYPLLSTAAAENNWRCAFTSLHISMMCIWTTVPFLCGQFELFQNCMYLVYCKSFTLCSNQVQHCIPLLHIALH